jgi:hypothetical protein
MTDLKEVLKNWAGKANVPPEKFEKEFMDLMTSEVVKASSPTEEGRQTTALRFLMSRHADVLIHSGGKAVPVTVLVIDKGSVRTAITGAEKEKVEVTDVLAVVKLEESNVQAPTLITLWREAARIVTSLIPGKFYTTQLVPKSSKDLPNGGKFMRMTSSAGAQWALSPKHNVDFDLRKAEKLFMEAGYKDWAPLADAKDSADQFRLVKGTIMRTYKGESKDGRAFGSMTIATDEMMWNPDTLNESNGLVVYIDPTMMRYGEQSHVMLIGTFQRSQKDTTQVNMAASGIIPDGLVVPYVDQKREGPAGLPVQGTEGPNVMGQISAPLGQPVTQAPPPADELFK